MSYMRSPYYVWVDGGRCINLWVRGTPIKEPGYVAQARMRIMDFDEIVAMRAAELGPSGMAKAEKRAMKNQSGNVGCTALLKKHGKPK